jgi:hypothetical protein
VQILDSPTAGYYDTGAIYDLVKPTKNAMKPVGEWNHLLVTCYENLITVVARRDRPGKSGALGDRAVARREAGPDWVPQGP